MKRLFVGLILGLAASVATLGAAADPTPPAPGHAPDPAPISREKHWVFEIVVTAGDVRIARVGAVTKKRPEPTARVMGRYALELRIGAELLDRVRFDVPLQGDGPREGRRGLLRGPSFTRVTTKLRADLADAPRATYLVLIDRASGAEQRFEWPPAADGSLVPWGTAPTLPATVDGGAADGDAGTPAEADAAPHAAPADAAPPGPDAAP